MFLSFSALRYTCMRANEKFTWPEVATVSRHFQDLSRVAVCLWLRPFQSCDRVLKKLSYILEKTQKLTIISAVTKAKGTLFYLDTRRIRFTYFRSPSFISVDISLPSPLNPSAFKSFWYSCALKIIFSSDFFFQKFCYSPVKEVRLCLLKYVA